MPSATSQGAVLTIVNEPFELKSRDGRSLPEMETSLKDLTEELAKSAASAKRNAPDKQKTHYFSMAKFKKSAAQIKNQERKSTKNKSKNNELE